MKLYIVIKNGKIDEVFDLYHNAIKHKEYLQKRWNLTYIVEKELNS